MRRPSSQLFVNPVTVSVYHWNNVNGARVRAASPTTQARLASVQTARTERVPDHLRSTGEISHVVFFDAPDPGVKVDDTITFGTRTLNVLGRAVDEAGRGALFAIYCKETT